jgi:hypothetical protein
MYTKLIASSILSILITAVWTLPARGRAIPTPESVPGPKTGADFYLANYDETRKYIRKIGRRLRYSDIRTTDGGILQSMAMTQRAMLELMAFLKSAAPAPAKLSSKCFYTSPEFLLVSE